MKKQFLLSAFVLSTLITNAQWQLTGNTGTNPATNFVGTTDTMPLIFRVFNVRSGLIDFTKLNTATGFQSGASITIGDKNTFFGAKSGLSNSTGSSNTFIGHQAGNNATTGSNNTFIGSSASAGTTIGIANTALGSGAGAGNTTGNFNTFVGTQSQASVANLTNATAIGANASVGASNSIVLGNSANVGIGVSTPLDKLHVVGNIRMVDGNQAAGKVLTSDVNGQASWQIVPPTTLTGAANGDLSGSYPNPTVDGLQGVAVAATVPVSGQVLSFNGTSWAPATLPAASVDWSVNGNAGTNAATNFIGTTDNVSLNFRVNNNRAGKIETGTIKNTFLGFNSGNNSLTGTKISLFGANAGAALTTAISVSFFGADAGLNNTSGNFNTFLGETAGVSNTTGSQNVFVGRNAGGGNINGTGNVAIGDVAGNFNDANTLCTFVGNDADQVLNTDFTNSTALGNSSRITASNQVRIGNSSVTSIGGFANWTNVSDGRFKKDVKETVPGMEFINLLRPVTYHLDVNAINKFVNVENADDNSIAKKNQQLQSGFIAQEVESAAQKTGYEFSGVDIPKNEDDFYGLRYAEFVVPMVKGMQELDAENKKLIAENNALKVRLEKIESLLGISRENEKYANTINVDISGHENMATLGQNYPNPFGNKSIIPYFIPVNAKTANIRLYTFHGKMIKNIGINTTGHGSLELNATQFNSGNYVYSLFIDNILVDTKNMVLIK